MLVGKALMTLEGIGKEIDPELDVFGEAAPYFFELMRMKRYSPSAVLWKRVVAGAASSSCRAPALRLMPMQVARDVLEDLRLGRMVLRTEDPGLPNAADRLGRRLFSGLVVVALMRRRAWRSSTTANTRTSAGCSCPSPPRCGRSTSCATGAGVRLPRRRDAAGLGASQPIFVANAWSMYAMNSAKSTSDSMKARPRMSGVWMRAEAPGLRETPSSADAAARP